ncbi:uncharacterized protein LOC134539003 [Bacillus rossius redtenbacheri]|uniref:uncharacterized protein LOC134539003 n=1 Tax=Bacillus rossius redtenbacheri TaxID=93214 RepID=UPI002FDD1549
MLQVLVNRCLADCDPARKRRLLAEWFVTYARARAVHLGRVTADADDRSHAVSESSRYDTAGRRSVAQRSNSVIGDFGLCGVAGAPERRVRGSNPRGPAATRRGGSRRNRPTDGPSSAAERLHSTSSACGSHSSAVAVTSHSEACARRFEHWPPPPSTPAHVGPTLATYSLDACARRYNIDHLHPSTPAHVGSNIRHLLLRRLRTSVQHWPPPSFDACEPRSNIGPPAPPSTPAHVGPTLTTSILRRLRTSVRTLATSFDACARRFEHWPPPPSTPAHVGPTLATSILGRLRTSVRHWPPTPFDAGERRSSIGHHLLRRLRTLVQHWPPTPSPSTREGISAGLLGREIRAPVVQSHRWAV